MLRRLWKVVKLLILAVVVFGVLVATLAYAMTRHFNTPPPKVTFPKPANDLEAQRQDLAYFRQLMALDRSFTPAARLEAERQLAGLENSDKVLDHPHFRVALMRILAQADNGHTHLDVGDKLHLRRLPVRVAWFSDGLYVMRTQSAASALLGGRIVAINGKPIDLVMEQLGALRGGTPAWRKLYATYYLSDPEILFGADIEPNAEHSTWTVATLPNPNSTDAAATVTLDAAAPNNEEPFIFPTRWLSGEPVKTMGDGWMAIQPDHASPVSLQDFDTAFRRIRLDHSCAMLIQLKANHDVGEQHIEEFLTATEADMRANKPCAVILDLRYDDGGNYQNTAAFARHLPELTTPGAHIYVLTGPSTFSAGITTTGFVKQAASDRVTLLGEPIGDRLSFFSEGNSGCLPNYPLCIRYQQGKHDYAHPCTDWNVCFWLNKLYPVRVNTLDPDETIAMSFDQWRQGQDPVFERAVVLATGTR